MKKRIHAAIIVIAIFFASLAFAEDLSDYPDVFIENGNFDAYIVVGNKAPAFHVILQSKLISFFNEYTGKQITGRAKLASEIDGLEQNLIMLGNPCENELSVLMSGYPLSCDYLDGKAGIFFVENGNYYNIIITGTDDDIKKSVDELLNYKKEDIEGTEHNVKEIEKEPKEEVDEQQKMIEELKKKIANSTASENATKEPAAEAEPMPEPQPVQISAEPEQNAREENKGFLFRFISWLRGLFR